MSDFSVEKASKSNNIPSKTTKKSEFGVLKKEYDSFMKKASKSDMANSQTMKEKEISLLEQMKTVAEKEGKKQDITWIDSRLEVINSELIEKQTPLQVGFYPPTSFKGASLDVSSHQIKHEVDFDKVLEPYTKEDGQVDENVAKIVAAFANVDDVDEYGLEQMLQRSCNDGTFTDDVVSGIEILAGSGIKPITISHMFDELKLKGGGFSDTIDLDLCQRIADLKLSGFSDFESLKIANFLGSGFKDVEMVKEQIIKLNKSNISPEATINIVKALSVVDPETSKKRVSQSAVQSIVQLKKIMSQTRKNEKAERDNPINHLGVLKLQVGDAYMIMKGDKVIHVPPVEGETVHDLKQEYDDLVSKLEDNLLIDCANKYRDKHGEIDSKFSRTMIFLRKNGISYDQLFAMTDYCVDASGINQNKLSAITQLKQAGALGVDVLPILQAVEKTPAGEFNPMDLQNACELSSAVIGGVEVAEILPEVRNDDTTKEFVVYFSSLLEDKSNLVKLISMVKNENGKVDENAVDMVYRLAQNFIIESQEEMSEKDFMNNVRTILSASITHDESQINEDASDICSIMCLKNQKPEQILQALELCKDSNGKINEKFAEILWDLMVKDVPLKDVEYIISSMKTRSPNE